ncbi:MAG: cytochrome c maturation protein CcmE [Bacteroidota bacterium]
MKIKHIVILIALVAAIGVVISLTYKPDTYSDFAQAARYPQRDFSIIGSLERDKVFGNDTLDGIIYFSFFMKDSKNLVKQVYYRGAEPQDFIKLEQVVVTGKMTGEHFIASSMVLKCPSKYNNKNVPEEFGEKEFR